LNLTNVTSSSKIIINEYSIEVIANIKYTLRATAVGAFARKTNKNGAKKLHLYVQNFMLTSVSPTIISPKTELQTMRTII